MARLRGFGRLLGEFSRSLWWTVVVYMDRGIVPMRRAGTLLRGVWESAKGERWFILACVLGSVAVGATAFAILQPFLWRWLLNKDPPASIDTVSSMLEVLVAIVALGVAAFGFGLFRFLRRELEYGLQRQRNRDQGWLAVKEGDMWWELYKALNRPQFLEEAIRVTQEAWRVYLQYLDEPDRANQRLLCSFKNTLGYFLAQRRREGDRLMALGCATYLEERSANYPDDAENFQDTVQFIRQRYP